MEGSRAMTGTTVFTVGHGTRSVDELAAILRAAGVTVLVDVRRHPGSRRSPQFGKQALAASLSALGVRYEWWGEELGGRRTASPSSRHVALRDPAFRGYADYMETPAFCQAIERLEALARSGEVPSILCAETLWWRCHRRLVADALVARGITTVHLLDARTRQAHEPTEAARIDDDGRLVYDRCARPASSNEASAARAR